MTAPLRFALVPVDPTDEMREARNNAYPRLFTTHTDDDDRDLIFRTMLAASPGNDLLERIVRALENHANLLSSGGCPVASDDVYNILNELGHSMSTALDQLAILSGKYAALQASHARLLAVAQAAMLLVYPPGPFTNYSEMMRFRRELDALNPSEAIAAAKPFTENTND